MILILIVAAATILLSIFAEFAALHFLAAPFSIVGSFVQLQLTGNPDIAFSMHLPGLLEPLLIGSALLLFLFFAWKSRKTLLNSFGFGLILGGALANIIDRLGDGLVTDYIRIGSFPIFNLPDSAITIGVALLLLEELLIYRKKGIQGNQ